MSDDNYKSAKTDQTKPPVPPHSGSVKEAVVPRLSVEALADHISDLVAEIDVEGRFLYVSPSCEQILGYTPEEMLAKLAVELTHPDDRKQARRAYVKAAMTGDVARTEHRGLHRDGSWRWIEDTAKVLRTESGEIRFLLIGRDVTERHRADDARAQQLRLQEQVSEISRYFLSARGDEIDAGVNRFLPITAQKAGAQRALLLVNDEATGEIGDVYQWIAPGFAHAHTSLDPEQVRQFRYSRDRLRQGQPLNIPRTAEVPDEASAEQADWEERGVLSCLVLPVLSDDRTIGFLIFEAIEAPREWSTEEVGMLTLLAEIYISALQRRRAEGALLESEARFRAITEHATELIAEFDGNGRYSYVSPSYRDLLGHDPATLLHKNGNFLVHPDDRIDSRDRFERATREVGDSRSLHRLRHADGSWRWFDNSGRAFRTQAGELRFVSLGRDITERKEAEEALERQLAIELRVAELSRRFMSIAPDDFEQELRGALADVADLAQADRCFLLAFGRHSAKPFDFFEWCAEGIDSAPAQEMPWGAKRIAAGKLLRVTQTSDLPAEANAERLELESRGVCSLLGIPIMSGQKLIGIIAFESMREVRHWSDQEITVLRLVGELFTTALRGKQTQIALRESQASLMQAQKMDAVGRLAGGIAHDFNNLLTVITGFSSPLLEELPEDDPVRDDVREIHDAAERAAALTSQLLTFSRRRMVEPRPVDLDDVIGGMEQILRRLLGEDVYLSVDLATLGQRVSADPSQLEQVILNLAVNARDAMPDGGKLDVHTQQCELSHSEIERLSLARPGRYVRLTVSDSGCGMDEDTRARAFDPFFTTKPLGEGTGLGLSIVYSVVEQCKGAVSVTASPGKGSTFEIFLPTVAAQTTETAEPQPSVEQKSHAGETVLLAEDEAAVRRLASRILRRHGYHVLEGRDGVDALEVAAAHPGKVHALVTDVVMPRMGGGELAQRLKEQNPDLRVIFMSGYPDDRAVGDRGPLLANEFLQKPFRQESLLKKLRACLDTASDEEAS